MLRRVASLGFLALIGSAHAQEAAIRIGNQVDLPGAEKSSKFALPGERITWSRDQHFLCSLANDGTLHFRYLPTGATGSLKGVKSYTHSPDGSALLIEQLAGGLAVAHLPSDKLIPISPSVREGSACWAPDGTRVAYAVGDALFVRSVKASDTPTKIISNRQIVATSWSGDGRLIAFSDSSGTFAMRPNGSGVTQLSAVRPDTIEWSPNGRFLLTRTADGYAVLNPATRSFDPVPCDPQTEPTWTGGQRLVVIQKSKAKKLYIGFPERSQEIGTIPAGTTAWAYRPRNEIGNDSIAEDPFKNLPKPAVGMVRLNGYVQASDPDTGQYDVSVESYVDPKGRLIVFSNPKVQKVFWAPGAVQTDLKRSRPIQANELREEDRVSLVVRGSGVNAELAALVSAWIEGESLEISTVLIPGAPLALAPRLNSPSIDSNGITMDQVTVPMVHPIAGKSRFNDTFLAPRSGGRKHKGQDVFAEKMTPLVACFDGKIRLQAERGLSGYSLYIDGDNGWQAFYCHLNNDNPNTDDGQGGWDLAFAPGIANGSTVKAGQFIGYVGDSGNAETTSPHLHFELKDRVTGATVNATSSLQSAVKLDVPGTIDLAERKLTAAPTEPAVKKTVSSRVMQYWPIITRYSTQAGLDPMLIAAIIQVESNGNPNLVSRAGAMGLMQLMPINCEEYGVTLPFDPDQNIRGGVAQMADHLRRFKGNLTHALVAYNAGPARVKNDAWKKIKETREYIPKVMSYFQPTESSVARTETQAKALDNPITFQAPVKEPTSVEILARRDSILADVKTTIPKIEADHRLHAIAEEAIKMTINGDDKGMIRDVSVYLSERAGFKNVKVHVLTTLGGGSFLDRWKAQKMVPATFAGVGFGKLGDRPYWCVVTADR